MKSHRIITITDLHSRNESISKSLKQFHQRNQLLKYGKTISHAVRKSRSIINGNFDNPGCNLKTSKILANQEGYIKF